MDPSLSEAESMLRDTARRLAEHLSCSTVSEFESFDLTSAWKALLDPGFVGLRLPEHVGGGGSTTLDAALVVEALANRLIPVPYLGSSLAIELLIAADTPSEVLERVSSGETRVSIGMTPDLAAVSTSAAGEVVAFDGADIDAVIVLSPDGLQLRSLAPGRPQPGADLTRRVIRADASVESDIGTLGKIPSPEAKGRFVARALSLLSADLVGVMSAALDVAVSYTSTRVQFGVPIGTFQAVQHLAADQMVSLEGARSMSEYAAWAADELDIDDALLAAHSAKAYASETGRTLCQAVIQMHGGMGITWDCLAHLYLKRALVDGLLFGDVAQQLSEVTDIRQRSAA